MTGRNSLHYFYDVSYQCWFASEEAKIYCNNFNNSNAVVCSHLILAYTVRLAIMNAVELERNDCCCFFFFYLYWGNVVLWLKRTSTKKLANRISYQIWYKGCLKGKFGLGPNPWGGPNPLWHRQIRKTKRSSSYVSYYNTILNLNDWRSQNLIDFKRLCLQRSPKTTGINF